MSDIGIVIGDEWKVAAVSKFGRVTGWEGWLAPAFVLNQPIGGKPPFPTCDLAH